MSEQAEQGDRGPVRYLVLAASMREGSLNGQLASEAARMIEENSGHVTRAAMKDIDCPSFNQDVQDSQGLPAGAESFKAALEECDGFVIASPEYNFSMPGCLKNAIDWVSRYRPQPFDGKHALLMSASPSMVGGNRGLWALRVPLEHLGARVYPDMFSFAKANEGFDDNGCIARESLAGRFRDTIHAFMDEVEASTRYPCMKRAWVEFLGED